MKVFRFSLSFGVFLTVADFYAWCNLFLFWYTPDSVTRLASDIYLRIKSGCWGEHHWHLVIYMLNRYAGFWYGYTSLTGCYADILIIKLLPFRTCYFHPYWTTYQKKPWTLCYGADITNTKYTKQNARSYNFVICSIGGCSAKIRQWPPYFILISTASEGIITQGIENAKYRQRPQKETYMRSMNARKLNDSLEENASAINLRLNFVTPDRMQMTDLPLKKSCQIQAGKQWLNQLVII